MITLSMTPYQIKKEMSIDIKNNIIPYLNRNYDNKIRRAILKSSRLPMIFDPIHYYSKETKNDWYIFYYAITKKKAEDAACLAVSLVESEKGIYAYEFVVCDFNDYPVYIFPPHFFSRYRARFVQDEEIDRKELVLQFIKRSYNAFLYIPPGMSTYKCGMSFQDGYGLGDVLSREFKIYMIKTFVSREMLKEDQEFARLFDRLKESNRLDYIMSRRDVEEYLNACFDDEFGIPGGHTAL